MHHVDYDMVLFEFGAAAVSAQGIQGIFCRSIRAEIGIKGFETIELTLTMLPPPCFFMIGMAFCMAMSGATTLSSITLL